MNSAITMQAKDSKDMDRLFSGMKEKVGAASFVLVNAAGVIVDAANDMRIARDLARFMGGVKVKSVHSGRIVFIAA